MFKKYKENDTLKEGIHVQVKLFEVNKDVVCVDFQKLEGCTFFFYEIYKDLQEKLDDLNDTLFEEISDWNHNI